MHRGSILCIVHQRTSYPGRLGRLLMERGFALDVRCPGVGQALPASPEGYAATLIFGGPMSANDDHLPAIAEELRWTERALASPQPLVGVCLGAQIMARVLGAKVWLHPREHVEIGYAHIRPTEHAARYFAGPMQVFQWHKEGFDLPTGATLLAAGGEDFPNQCFRYDSHCYGMQFHPEVTFDMMCRWTTHGAHMLTRPGAMPRDEVLRLHPIHDPPFGAWAENFVDHVLGLSETRGCCAPGRCEDAA